MFQKTPLSSHSGQHSMAAGANTLTCAGGWTLRATSYAYQLRHVHLDRPLSQRSTTSWAVARAPPPPPGASGVCPEVHICSLGAAKWATIPSPSESERSAHPYWQATAASGCWQRRRAGDPMAVTAISRHFVVCMVLWFHGPGGGRTSSQDVFFAAARPPVPRRAGPRLFSSDDNLLERRQRCDARLEPSIRPLLHTNTCAF